LCEEREAEWVGSGRHLVVFLLLRAAFCSALSSHIFSGGEEKVGAKQTEHNSQAYLACEHEHGYPLPLQRRADFVLSEQMSKENVVELSVRWSCCVSTIVRVLRAASTVSFAVC
jgi:hypothetical protein